MNLQNFIDAVNRYDGVDVVSDESGHYVEIIFNKYFEEDNDAPIIEFYWPTESNSITLWGSEALPSEALLQMSKVMKLAYEFLQKGTWYEQMPLLQQS